MRLYPADILAVRRRANGTDIHLVECKNLSKRRGSKRIYIEASQMEKLQRWSERHKAEAFVAYSFPYQRAMILPIDRVRSDDSKYFVEREDGEPLKHFLSELPSKQSRL
jgi:Holliday junction resolvase